MIPDGREFQILLAGAAVIVPFAGAALVGLLGRVSRGASATPGVALCVAATCALLVALLWFGESGPIFLRTAWIAALGIGVGLYVDALSLLFAVLVVGVSLLSLVFSLAYIPHELEEREQSDSGQAAYYAYMLLFTGSMLGVVLAPDLIQLYVFWELTGIASFLLIGLHWSEAPSRSGAIKALVVTAFGGLAMLLGFLLLGLTVGTFSLPDVLRQREALLGSPYFGLVLLLVLVGAAAKSAQVPFHVWLPGAMVAPTPVSAFLHSAALVAAGVYLLARFHPLLAGPGLWQWAVTGVGVASLLVGGVLALKARGLKELLAYSTISQYGIIFALLGLATAEAVSGALFGFFQHGVIKAGLFFSAGVVTYATGRKGLGETDGLWRALPAAFAIAGVLALSLGGLPPLAGFWVKEEFLKAALATHSLVLVGLGLAAGVLTLTYMLRFVAGAFVGGGERAEHVEPVPLPLLVGPGLLASLTLLFGVWPGLAAESLVAPAARAVLGEPVDLTFSIHLNLTLLLSLVALAGGVLAFATHARWVRLVEALARPSWSLDLLYARIAGVLSVSGRLLSQLQNGMLQRYIHISLLGLLALVVYAAVVSGLILNPLLPSDSATPDWGLEDSTQALLLALVVVGAVLTFVVNSHLHVVLALSVVGYLIAGVFALRLAPDVALVQVHVETLVTVLFVFGLATTPGRVRRRVMLTVRQRLGAGRVIFAVLGGVAAAWLSWAAMEHTPTDPIAPWFNEHALTLAEASDVVAAILVNFRALDTLGEITVFATAAAGVLALMRLMRGQEP